MTIKPNGFNTDYILKGEGLESYNLQLMLEGAEEPHLPRALKLAMKAALTEAMPGYREESSVIKYVSANPGILAQNETQVIGLFHPRTGSVNKWHALPTDTMTQSIHPRDANGNVNYDETIEVEKRKFTKTKFWSELQCLFKAGGVPARLINFFMQGKGLTAVIKRIIPGINNVCIDIGLTETLNDEKTSTFYEFVKMNATPSTVIKLWMYKNRYAIQQIRGSRSLQTATLVKTDDGYVLRLQYTKQNSWLGDFYWEAVNNSVGENTWSFVPLWTNETNPDIKKEIDEAMGVKEVPVTDNDAINALIEDNKTVTESE